MSLLKDIYGNKLHPINETSLWGNEEYAMLSREASEIEDQISAVSPEVEELFEKYQELQNRIGAISHYHEFTIGVRFGAQLMEEMLKPFE